MDTENKTVPSADWDDDDAKTATWEIPVILAAVAIVTSWRTFRAGFEELPTWLYESFWHAVAIVVMGITVFPEARWWFVAIFATPCAISAFAMGLVGMMEAVDPSGTDDWFGEDSKFWGRRAFVFATVSMFVAPFAYLR